MPKRYARDWTIPEPKGSVAIVHGLAEHSGRYEHVAAALNQAGYQVHAVDLRGHGGSEGWPGMVSGVGDWHEDAAFLLDRARERADGLPVFLLGHSMGSLVAASYVVNAADPPDGLILSAYAGLAGQALLEAMSDPDSPSIPADAICRDPEVVKAYVSDELVFYDRVPVECNAAALEAAIAANQSAAAISLPTLMLHGTGDLVCDIEGAREFHEALGSPDKELLVYEGLYHEVMNEPEKDRVLADIVAWLDRHTSE